MSAQEWYRGEYLHSDHWRETRLRKLEAAGWQCERCGQQARRTVYETLGGLDVHHKTYERVNREELDDLEVLCFRCHAIEHGQPSDDRSLVKRQRVVGLEYEPDEIDLEIQSWDEIAERNDLGLA